MAELDSGIPGSSAPVVYSPRYGTRRAEGYRALGSSPPPRSDGSRFFCEPTYDDEPHHFLDACFLCKKPIGGNRDIFMYRGDTPFCSEECREEQIEMDEAKERKWNLYCRKEQQQQKIQKHKPKTPQNLEVSAAGTLVVDG